MPCLISNNKASTSTVNLANAGIQLPVRVKINAALDSRIRGNDRN